MSGSTRTPVSVQESCEGCAQESKGNWYQVVNKVDELKYVFSWETISTDIGQLVDFLRDKFNIKLTKGTNIERIEANKTIKISNEKISILLKLNDEGNEVALEINGVEADKLVVKMEDGRLNIYGFVYIIMQGDIINGCPCVIPPADIQQDAENVTVKIKRYRAIVMNQTCDIVQNKTSFVLVCPIWTLKELGERDSHFSLENNKEALRRGYQHGFILLDECANEGFDRDYFVVECKNAFSVPLKTLKEIIKNSDNRLRLRPPYREYVSRSFGNFFGRVALPKEINKFNQSFKLDHCEECEYRPSVSS